MGEGEAHFIHSHRRETCFYSKLFRFNFIYKLDAVTECKTFEQQLIGENENRHTGKLLGMLNNREIQHVQMIYSVVEHLPGCNRFCQIPIPRLININDCFYVLLEANAEIVLGNPSLRHLSTGRHSR